MGYTSGRDTGGQTPHPHASSPCRIFNITSQHHSTYPTSSQKGKQSTPKQGEGKMCYPQATFSQTQDRKTTTTRQVEVSPCYHQGLYTHTLARVP